MPAAKKRPILTGITHGTSGYRKGCGCAKCRGAKSAERADERKRRAARTKQTDAAPAAPPVAAAGGPSAQAAQADPSAAGEVEQAVRDELQQHDGAPGLGAMRAVAIRLAREVDDAGTPSVSASASTLLRYLTEIRKASRQSDGSLDDLVKQLGAAP